MVFTWPTIQQYIQFVNKSIITKNGNNLTRLLRCSDGHMRNPNLINAEPESYTSLNIRSPWEEAVITHLRTIYALKNEDFEEAYACQVLLTQAVTKILTDLKDCNWILPIAMAVAVDLRRFAHALDQRSEAKHSYGGRMEKTATRILKLFQLCASDSRTQVENSKKLGMMGLANQLFKIYFQINRLNLCKPMIRAIDNMDINHLFSLAQRVTYSYYVGRKAMFDRDFASADKSLTYAFEHCIYQRNRNNKRLILIYLIPVKMLLGVMPSENVMRKYNLTEFIGIVKAVISGNLKMLNTEMNEYETFFINCGVYLILEKLKSITYRNLFKRVSYILQTHLLPIGAFKEAIKFMGVDDIDDAETECILANLIYEGKIKGYIAHQQQKIVVSKVQAFPPLNST